MTFGPLDDFLLGVALGLIEEGMLHCPGCGCELTLDELEEAGEQVEPGGLECGLVYGDFEEGRYNCPCCRCRIDL